MTGGEWHPVTECDVPELEINETWQCDCGRTWSHGHPAENRTSEDHILVTESQISGEFEFPSTLVEAKPENSMIWLESDVLNGRIEAEDPDKDVVVQIAQHTTDIVVQAGVPTESEADTHAMSYAKINPEQARELADALYLAAENSEREFEGSIPDPDTTSESESEGEQPSLFERLTP
jgi:hypothetical protein